MQLDIIKSSGLPFHTLFSSDLLGKTKASWFFQFLPHNQILILEQPNPGMYLKALQLLKVAPAEAMMVAAHAYDLKAAKRV